MIKFKDSEIEVKLLLSLIISILLGVLTNYLFGQYGFNPTDEGFILAYSKRIIIGEIPHKDFISIRPIFSAYLHTFTYLFYDYGLFYVSRLIVNIEFALISVLSLNLINKIINRKLKLTHYIANLILVHYLSLHNFPFMSWHTIDGLLFVVIGMNLYFAKYRHAQLLGIFVISISAICKQNFIIIAPLFQLLIRKDLKLTNILNLSISFLPILIYILVFSLLSSISEIKSQLLTQSNFLKYAFLSYINPLSAFGVVLSLCGYYNKKYFVISYFVVLITTLSLFISNLYLIHSAYIIFGYTFIIAIYEKNIDIKNIYRIILLIAWTSSISVGYNSPIFMLGQLMLLPLLKFQDKQIVFYKKKILIIAFITAMIVFLTRFLYVYRDENTNKLTNNLGIYENTLSNIYSNIHTYNKIREVNILYDKYAQNKKKVMILPDFAYFWANKNHVNSICIDWAQSTELNSNILINKVMNNIDQLDTNLVILIQRYESDRVENKEIYLSDKYVIVNYIKNNFTIIERTNYFIIYKKI